MNKEELDNSFRSNLKKNIEELKWWQKLPLIRNHYLIWCYLEAIEYTFGGFK